MLSTLSFYYVYVYILKLKDNSVYIGFSSNLKRRLKTHIEGCVSATKNLRPAELIYYSAFTSQKKATDFEKYLKSSSSFAFRNKRLV